MQIDPSKDPVKELADHTHEQGRSEKEKGAPGASRGRKAKESAAEALRAVEVEGCILFDVSCWNVLADLRFSCDCQQLVEVALAVEATISHRSLPNT